MSDDRETDDMFVHLIFIFKTHVKSIKSMQRPYRCVFLAVEEQKIIALRKIGLIGLVLNVVLQT